MKVKRVGRSLFLSDLPRNVDGIETPKRLGPFELQITYAGDGNAHKAIILDNYIIPLIVAALEGKNFTKETLIKLDSAKFLDGIYGKE